MSSTAKEPATLELLVVDDDSGQRSLLSTFLKGQGFQVTLAESGQEALEFLEDGEFDMMISDVRMPGLSGLETLRKVREAKHALPVLMVTAFPDIRDAVTAMQDGAVNYLQKPVDLDELLSSVRRATGLESSEPLTYEGNKALPDGIVATGPLMQQVFRDAALVSDSDSRILITGESGTGKEVVSDVIHGWSPRAKGPFIKINCAAIPENLLESELFGHRRGAFTGATTDRVGKFEEAQGGTILLDEIGEMSPSLQAKLLRVTQDGVFQKIGTNTDLKTDARILAATNRDLEREVEEGRFREDLFYRLNVMEICIPSLRERPEDILPLANTFIAEFSDGASKLTPGVTGILTRYNWPGNVRELRNAMERAVLMSHGGMILADHLPPRILKHGEGGATASQADSSPRLEEIERQAILNALQEHQFNRTRTAQALGISRRALTYKLQSLRQQGYKIDR